MDKYYIPKYLDCPMHFFLLTLDELILFLIVFLSSLFFLDQVISGLSIGFLIVYSLKKIKRKHRSSFIYAWLYWYLPPIIILQYTPNSYIRFIRG